MRTLVTLFHPTLDTSRANARLFDAVRTLPNVTARHFETLYPGHTIDVDAEHALLLEHDLHVFQFPFYWFSSPPSFKAWQDQALTWGWAFGPKRMLEGKTWQVATTLGGAEHDYAADGLAGHTVDEILLPVRLTASYCGIRWRPPFCAYAVTPNTTDDALDTAASRYREQLTR